MKKSRWLAVFVILILLISLLTGCSLDIFSDAEDFSESVFLSMIEQGVIAQQAELSYTCRKADDLESKIDSALNKAYTRYIIGSNVENILWSIETLVDSTVKLELEYSDTFEDNRSSALEYSPEVMAGKLEDTILVGGTANLLFENDGTLTDDLLKQAVNDAVFESKSALMNYYVDAAQYVIATYADYASVTIEFDYHDKTIPYEELSVPTDLRNAAELLAAQWDSGQTAILYYPDGHEDPEGLCEKLVAIATANDVDDPYLCPSCEWLVYGESDLLLSFRKVNDYDINRWIVQRKELLKEAETIAGSLTQTETEEKIKELGKILADRIVYDHELANAITADAELSHEQNIGRTAYGALVSGRTVCSGYAKAFKLICDLVGIDCWVVDGKVDGEGHEWNTVYFDGEMHYVDITFADTGKMKKFYLFDQKTFEKEEYMTDEGFFVPAA